jgi:hypothetical protein
LKPYSVGDYANSILVGQALLQTLPGGLTIAEECGSVNQTIFLSLAKVNWEGGFITGELFGSYDVVEVGGGTAGCFAKTRRYIVWDTLIR